jgi:hypothetical protein
MIAIDLFQENVARSKEADRRGAEETMGGEEGTKKNACRKRTGSRSQESCSTEPPFYTRGTKQEADRGHDEGAYRSAPKKGGQTHAVWRSG